MTRKYHICLILLFCILTSCKKVETDIDEIPVEDRFVYRKGDKLTYKNIGGNINVVFVKDYRFWKESGAGTDMFGGSHPWIRDEQRIVLESSSDSWQKVLPVVFESDLFDSPCIIIETINTIYNTNSNPFSSVLNGCSEGGLPVIANSGIKYSQISINNNSYEKVYFFSRDYESNSLKVYWNLKYGIILFESIIDGKQEIWNLENPKM